MWNILESAITAWEENVMLSPERIEQYRRMTMGERMRLVLDMCRDSTRFLLMGDPDQVARKFELIERENSLRNDNMLRAIARTREPNHGGH